MRATLMYGAGDVRVETVPAGYQAMARREALKVLVRP